MVTLQEYLLNFVDPLLTMAISFFFLLRTLATQPLLLLTSPSSFRSKWFERLYAYIGPQVAATLQYQPYIEPMLSHAHGVILELGPGGGDQTYHYKADQVDKIYGAEPNEHFYPALLTKAKDAGLGERYIPLKAGAQPDSLLPALREAGLLPKNTPSLPAEGIFDCVVAIRSLCSVPQSQLDDTVAVIMTLLKPGGEFQFFEHLQNDRSLFTQSYAWMLNLCLWPEMIGGCRLDCKLDKVVLGMSGWRTKQVENIREYQGHEVFRYAKGVCVKG